MSTDIEQVQTALVEFDRVAAGLALLQKNYAGVLFDVETPNGMELAKASRQVLRKPRYEIERIRKEAKAPLLAIGKKLDSEAQRITAEIMKLEDPIDQQIKSEEGRKQREKEEAEFKEAARLAAIQTRLDAIRRLPLQATGKTVAHAESILEQAMATDLHGLGAEGDEILNTAIYAIKGVIAEREQHEAEQARIAAEREELAKLRAAQEVRDAETRRVQEAETARQAEEMRRAREQLDRDRAEQDRLAQEREEEQRQKDAEARAMREATEADLRRQREAFAAEQEAARVAKQRELTQAQEKNRQHIVDLVAADFKVKKDDARKMLHELFA